MGYFPDEVPVGSKVHTRAVLHDNRSSKRELVLVVRGFEKTQG